MRAQIGTEVEPGDRLSFVVADLTADEGWDAAVTDCAYVLHVAAPVGVDAPRDPDQLIGPTRDGALRVLRAACRAKVGRVVMTSAIEACRPPLAAPDGVTDETRWTDTSDPRIGPYRLAKTLAEKPLGTSWSTSPDRRPSRRSCRPPWRGLLSAQIICTRSNWSSAC